MDKATRIHEAGHAVVWLLEEEQLGPLRLVTALPYENSLGRVRGENEPGALPPTPRKLRATARMSAAGAVAERLAGFDPKGFAQRDDLALAGAAWVTKRGARFVEEARAGAELQLRMHWGAVLDAAGLLLELGALTPPYGIELLRMALAKPPRPLAPDAKTLARLVSSLAKVPELYEPSVATLRGLARAA